MPGLPTAGCAVALCLAVTVATPSSAAPLTPAPIVASASSSQPEAVAPALIFFGAQTASLKWYGRGAISQEVPICVSTPTGRYRLEINTLMGGMAARSSRIPYTIVFRDSQGDTRVLTTENSPNLSFDGVAPAAADCLQGPNATVTFVLDEQHLVAGVAGNYADHLRFAVQER